jgi:hypothetical protein
MTTPNVQPADATLLRHVAAVECCTTLDETTIARLCALADVLEEQ